MAAAVCSRRLVKTALHQAVLDTRLHQVRLLVCRHAVDVDSRDMYGRTPLMLACLLADEQDGYRMSQILLTAGTYMNIKDNLHRTALHYACMKGRERQVRRFLRDDVTEVSVADVDGNTPLMHAAMAGFPSIVALLTDTTLRFGRSVDDRNRLGYTALLLACKYARYASAHELLTKGGSDPSVRDNEFFFNALQWLQHCGELHASFRQQQLLHPNGNLPRPRYAREDRMYEVVHDRPDCHHAHTTVHPLGESLDTALRLPAIFSYLSLERPMELCLGGDEDARAALLQAIEAVMRARQTRTPVSRNTCRALGAGSRGGHPSTAKLLRSCGGGRVMVPDMVTLFKLYSDQYENRALLRSGRQHGKPRHIRICTPGPTQF